MLCHRKNKYFPLYRANFLGKDFPGGSDGKNSPANAGDTRNSGLISGSGRSPGEGNGNPLQYSCLGSPMDKGAWRATVHGIAKSLGKANRTIKFHRNSASVDSYIFFPD